MRHPWISRGRQVKSGVQESRTCALRGLRAERQGGANMKKLLIIFSATVLLTIPGMAQVKTPAGFTSLFNGKDLNGWKVPPGPDWKVVDGVIDCNVSSQAREEQHLWTEKEYKDFILRVDWRVKATPFRNKNARIILPDGSEKLGLDGKPVFIEVPDTDSGIVLRGSGRGQINIWGWPVGSGELWSIRRDQSLTAEQRAAATPKLHADRNFGEWNTFEITMRGERLTVVLNGKTVIDNAQVPGLPEKGPLGLQHHGRVDAAGQYIGPPSLVQFRNIFVKEL
jgi:hypothetical protein